MENYIVSARKYRPATFDSVVGQKALTETLKNAVATNRLAHSYLFCGSRGVGKTSCARIFAKTINCEHRTADGEACNECDSCRSFNNGTSMNIIELDAASNNGIDDMRSLVEQVQIPPSQGRYRVFIVDEVHMLSTAAFNSFLKTLEEPPHYVVFILATTEKHKIIPTILSRCQIYDFHRIGINDMVNHLGYVASREGITAEPSALNIIARKADGAMRDALSIFDQVAASTRGNITYKATVENLNVLDTETYGRLLDAILGNKPLDTWMIYKEIRDRGFDSQFFINGLASYFRDLMVARDPSTLPLLEAPDDVCREMHRAASRCNSEMLFKAISLCNDADLNYRTASSKQLLIEITLAKICQLCQQPGPSQSNGGGEGQLKPIAADRIPAAAEPKEAVQTPSTQQSPASTPRNYRPQQPRPTLTAEPKSPVITPRGNGRTLLRSTGISSLRARANEPSVTGLSETEKRQPRNNPFSDDKLESVWEEFMGAHPKEHILVNTMRAAHPTKREGATYEIIVENEIQHELMEHSMPEILRFVRERLQNDSVSFTISVNKGDSARHTWNDRELLMHMVEEIPMLKKFIDDFKLTLS